MWYSQHFSTINLAKCVFVLGLQRVGVLPQFMLPSFPMTDPWCWYINANIHRGYIDGIHVTFHVGIYIYIPAPWIRHGFGPSFGEAISWGSPAFWGLPADPLHPLSAMTAGNQMNWEKILRRGRSFWAKVDDLRVVLFFWCWYELSTHQWFFWFSRTDWSTPSNFGSPTCPKSSSNKSHQIWINFITSSLRANPGNHSLDIGKSSPFMALINSG